MRAKGCFIRVSHIRYKDRGAQNITIRVLTVIMWPYSQFLLSYAKDMRSIVIARNNNNFTKIHTFDELEYAGLFKIFI
jgi:hypothetical protein